MPLQIRRGTDAERLAMTVPLAQGELLYVTNTQKLYIGNGTTLAGSLTSVTGYTDADAKDAAAAIFTSGSHSGIGFSYNTATNVITATVDLSNYSGTINASSFKGTLVADDSTMLIDAIDGKINLDGTIKGNLIPDSNEAYDLGSPARRFRDLYLSGSSIELGNATITATGSAINLPAGSTIGGEPLNAANLLTQISANIIADDSTVIVNTTTKTVTAGGGFIGNVTGNVVGDVTGNVFTNFIDSTDSTAILVTPKLVLESDLDIGNDLTVNRTVFAGGGFFGNLSGNVTGNLTGSLTGNVIGNVNGNLTGNVDGNVIGNVTGNVSGNVFGDVIANDLSILVNSVSGLITGDVDSTNITAGSIVINKTPNTGGISIFSQASLDNDVDLFTIVTAHNTNTASGMSFTRSRGTLASPAPVGGGDGIFSFLFVGQNAVEPEIAASIDVSVDGFGAGTPGKIAFSTRSALGNLVERLSISARGTAAFGGMVQLRSYANEAAADAALNGAGNRVNGMMYYDLDLNKVRAVANGTWVDLH